MKEPHPGRRARAFFEQLWQAGDRWELDSSELDRASRARQIELLADRRYSRALEVGCAAGAFTEMLVGLAERVLAVDIAPSAIERARDRGLGSTCVELRVANVMELERQEMVSGTKQDVAYDVLISLFRKPATSRST